MASICLYDVDLLHSSKFTPNLELMKVFNYYYSRGDIINLATKGENLSRYNQIIYFKQRPGTPFPKGLPFCGENIQIHGYGFYKKFTPLNDKFSGLPPNYLCYDLIEDKLKDLKLYNKIKKGSLIRIENNDFSDFKPEQKNIFIADFDVITLSAATDFFNEYHSNYNLNFLFSLVAKNEEDFLKIFPYVEYSNRRVVIDFPFSDEFFFKYFYEKVMFPITQHKGEENPNVFLQRISKMILAAKNVGKRIDFEDYNPSKIVLKEKPIFFLLPYILNWNKEGLQETFFDFLRRRHNKEVLNIEQQITNRNLRLLLKQNPVNFDTQQLDLFSIL